MVFRLFTQLYSKLIGLRKGGATLCPGWAHAQPGFWSSHRICALREVRGAPNLGLDCIIPGLDYIILYLTSICALPQSNSWLRPWVYVANIQTVSFDSLPFYPQEEQSLLTVLISVLSFSVLPFIYLNMFHFCYIHFRDMFLNCPTFKQFLYLLYFYT